MWLCADSIWLYHVLKKGCVQYLELSEQGSRAQVALRLPEELDKSAVLLCGGVDTDEQRDSLIFFQFR